jgi:CheY-like chemotaxis protein
MDGYAAAEMIKADAAAQGIPPPHIVIVSGDEPSEVQERCSRCGLDFLPKPVGREQFRNVLSAHGIAV